MHQHTLASNGGEQAHLGRADDGACPHRDVAGLHIVAGAANIGSGPDAAQHRHPRLAAVGPPQRQHRVGERRHRRTGLHARGLAGLQPARRAGTGLDRAHDGQTDLAVPLVLAVLITTADTEHVHTAHGVSVNRGLIETRQRTFGDDLLGAHQTLRFGDGYSDRSGCYRSGRYPGLLLLHRTHHTPI